MRRIISIAFNAIVGLTIAYVGVAWAQSFLMPPPAGVVVLGCVYQSSPPTLTTGQTGFAQCDSTGHLSTGGGGPTANVAIVSPVGPSTASTAAVAITDTGTPITGQTLSAGGQGLIGWLSQIYAGVTGAIPTGTNIIGKVGIDQTTPGTTNGVTIAPTSASGAAIASVVSGSGEASHVLKASAGNLYTAYATNLTGTQGFLVILNATSAPADGAVTPLDCAPLAANGIASVSYRPGPAKSYSTGITAVVTSASTCFTKTTGVITAFFSGDVQ